MIAAVTVSTAFTSCNSKGSNNESGNAKLSESSNESVKESNNVKLLETITEKDKYWSKTTDFEYDDQNRLVKMRYNGKTEYVNTEITTTITYTDNSVTVKTLHSDDGESVKKYLIKGNTVTVGKETLTLNKEGYILSIKSSELQGCGDVDEEGNVTMVPYLEKYEYEDGNLTRNYDNGGDCDVIYGSSAFYQYDSQQIAVYQLHNPEMAFAVFSSVRIRE